MPCVRYSGRQVASGPRSAVAEKALSLAEREEISRGLSSGEGLRAIAVRLGRAPSTVCREVERKEGRARYRACAADRRAQRLARRRKAAKLARCVPLQAVVEAKLALKWSPQQISRWLPGAFPSDPEMRVSHETIYMALYIQGRGALRQELHRALRTGCALRQPKKSVANGQGMWSVRRLDHRRHRLGRRGPLVEHWNGTS